MQRQPMNQAQRRILVFSLLIIILLAVLYFLFFSDSGLIAPKASPEPSATFLTVEEARDTRAHRYPGAGEGGQPEKGQ